MQVVSRKLLKAPCGCQVDPSTTQVTISDSCVMHRDGKHAVEAVSAMKKSFFQVIVPNSVQEGMARRGLEKKLAFNLNACRAHVTNGVPRGHSAHCLLYNESVALLEEYAGRFMADKSKQEAMATLYSWFPAMYVLKAKATPPPTDGPKPNQKKASIVVRLVIGLPLLGAVMVGIYQGAHHWIVKLVGG